MIEREREKKEREEERRESRSAALLSGPGKALLDTPPPALMAMSRWFSSPRFCFNWMVWVELCEECC